MNLVEQMCKKLGVEVDEVWLANNGNTYAITESRIIERYKPKEYSDTDYKSWVVSDDSVYASILRGEIKPVWKPKQYEKYYMPNLYHFNDEEKYDSWCWEGYEQEEWLLGNNMVFRTKEEAIEATNKMLKALKGD